MQIKIRYVTNPKNMKIVEDGTLKIREFDNSDFKGDVALIKFNKMKEPFKIDEVDLCMADDNYKWLEFYDYSSKIKLTAIYNNKNEIVEWYFDIARRIGKENGVPYEDDLYLDVVVTCDGEIKLLDEDELKTAFDKFEISKQEYDMAYKEANELMNKLKNNKDKLREFTDKYLMEMLEEEEIK